jgi:hypothetical protein
MVFPRTGEFDGVSRSQGLEGSHRQIHRVPREEDAPARQRSASATGSASAITIGDSIQPRRLLLISPARRPASPLTDRRYTALLAVVVTSATKTFVDVQPHVQWSRLSRIEERRNATIRGPRVLRPPVYSLRTISVRYGRQCSSTNWSGPPRKVFRPDGKVFRGSPKSGNARSTTERA